MKSLASTLTVLALAAAAHAATPQVLVTYSPMTIQGTVTKAGVATSGTTTKKILGVTVTTVKTTTTPPVVKYNTAGFMYDAVRSGTLPVKGYELVMKTQYSATGAITSTGVYAVQKPKGSKIYTEVAIPSSAIPVLSSSANQSFTTTVNTKITSGSTSVTTVSSDASGMGTVLEDNVTKSFLGSITQKPEVSVQDKVTYPYTELTLDGIYYGADVNAGGFDQGTISVAKPTVFMLVTPLVP